MKTVLYIPPKNDLEGFGKGQVMVLIGQFLKEGLSLVRQVCSIFFYFPFKTFSLQKKGQVGSTLIYNWHSQGRY